MSVVYASSSYFVLAQDKKFGMLIKILQHVWRNSEGPNGSPESWLGNSEIAKLI